MSYTPDTEGIDHINIYSKSKIQVGRGLSNFAYTPFIYKPYGKFLSVEGFWYYYLTGCKYPKLKKLAGYEAKEYGRRCKGYRDPNDEDIKVILEAIRCKLRQNKMLLRKLTESTLPLTHYYAYGDIGSWKVYDKSKYSWITDEITRIRSIMQNKK